MGMFYKRRDYSTIVDGRNPIVAHEFLGADVRGKDMIIVDDMISSGDSMLEVAQLLKDLENRTAYPPGLGSDPRENSDHATAETTAPGI